MKWKVFKPDLEDITEGAGKGQRIGTKIFLRYLTINLEIYPGTSTPAFPSMRVVFAKDRNATTMTSAALSEDNPLERPDITYLEVLSDDCFGWHSTATGASTALPSRIKITK